MRGLTADMMLALHALHLMLRKRKPVTIAEIRKSSGFDFRPVRSVMAKLRLYELIRSRSGHGFVLAKAPGEITIQNVMQAIDQPQPPTSPCSGDFEACASRASCLLAPLCRSVDQGLQETLRSFTLAELMDVPLGLPNCLDPKSKAS
jgi:Rrf2 family protein